MDASLSSVQDDNLRGMAVSSISLVTFAIGANVVFLRMYVRIKRHITGWDDYTICVASVTVPSDLTPKYDRPRSLVTGTISFGHGR